MKRPQLIAGVAILVAAGGCAIAVPAAIGSASAAVATGPAPSRAASSTAAGTIPFGAVAGGFVPLAGGEVTHLSVGAGKTVTVTVAGHADVCS